MGVCNPVPASICFWSRRIPGAGGLVINLRLDHGVEISRFVRAGNDDARRLIKSRAGGLRQSNVRSANNRGGDGF